MKKSGLFEIEFEKFSQEELNKVVFQANKAGGLTWLPDVKDFEAALFLETKEFSLETPQGIFEVSLPWLGEDFAAENAIEILRRITQEKYNKIISQKPEFYPHRRNKKGDYILDCQQETDLQKIKNARDLHQKVMLSSLREINNCENYGDELDGHPPFLFNVRFYPHDKTIPPKQLCGRFNPNQHFCVDKDNPLI